MSNLAFHLIPCPLFPRRCQVDVVVEVRSEGGEFQYVGPHLKVTYLRAPVPVEDGQRRDAGAASRRIRHANQMSGRLGSVDEGPNVSYRCLTRKEMLSMAYHLLRLEGVGWIVYADHDIRELLTSEEYRSKSKISWTRTSRAVILIWY